MDLLTQRRAMMTDVPEPTPPTIIDVTAADFSLSGVWYWETMTVYPAGTYKSVPIIEVNPGDLVEWIDLPTIATTSYVLAAYDREDNPVVIKSGYNRWQYTDIRTNLYRTVPAGVYKIGLIWTSASLASWTETSKIRITKYP